MKRSQWHVLIQHDDCLTCEALVEDALSMARATGSVEATQTVQLRTQQALVEHSATVTRESVTY